MNYELDIFDRLKGQQPVIDNPEELTDSIMQSLPEQDDIVIKEHKGRLMPIIWRWVAAAACLLIIIGIGVGYQFSDSPQPISQSTTVSHPIDHGQSVNQPRSVIQSTTVNQIIGEHQLCNRRAPTEQLARTNQTTGAHQITDPNIHYASHEAEDTVPYLAPSLVDDFIGKFAEYNNIKAEPLECNVINKDSTIQSIAYVFPDNDRIKLFERLLGVVSQYSYKSPGYQFTISQQQILFCLEDHRLGLRYLWLAERLNGDRIILYTTHSPIGISVSLECYQNFRGNVTHTNKTFKL